MSSMSSWGGCTLTHVVRGLARHKCGLVDDDSHWNARKHCTLMIVYARHLFNITNGWIYESHGMLFIYLQCFRCEMGPNCHINFFFFFFLSRGFAICSFVQSNDLHCVVFAVVTFLPSDIYMWQGWQIQGIIEFYDEVISWVIDGVWVGNHATWAFQKKMKEIVEQNRSKVLWII